ncbi:MAG: ATP-binding protein [Deltaproteobacteria bacterium]|nr:ATP-binding protein [Deltaproteobacteria bacterium]
MSVTGTVVALVSDSVEKAVWGPVFSRMREKTILVELRDIFHLVADFRQKGKCPSVMLISTRVYPLENPELVSQFRQLFPESDIMLMGLSTDPPPPLELLLQDKVRHLLINPIDGSCCDTNRVSSLFDLSIRRLKKGLPLYLADYIKPGTTIHEYRVTSSEQKETLITELENTIAGQSKECEMLRMKGALLADEMLENAFYAAPRDEHCEPLYRKGENRTLSDRENVVFRYGFDGETLALEVTDGWGTLSPEVFFEHVTQNMESLGPHEEIGGRGLFIIWRFLDSLHIRVAPGMQTVIGGHIRLASAENHAETKGFHICTIPSTVVAVHAECGAPPALMAG